MKAQKHFNNTLIIVVVGALFNFQCARKHQKGFTPQEVANTWADMTVYVAKNTPQNSPTFASRCFGYIGLTMYESIVHGYIDHHSMAGQLNGLDSLPMPEAKDSYNWVLCLNAGQAYILKSIYIQTSDENKKQIDSLEKIIFDQFSSHVDEDEVNRSVKYGQSIAEAIFEWSKTDGGHRGYLNNFDKALVLPRGPGSWEPPLYSQAISHSALHPHWGDNRTFVKDNALLPIPGMISYDTTKGSAYYMQHMRVYEKDKTLTQEQKEAAIWWGDDPSDTFTPPGHSYYLGSVALRTKGADMITCAETYARVGVAIADAFINCWKWKYHYFSERPSSFIPRNIDKEWVSFWPDPPFPSFPSGHAIQAATAATVFADLLGNEINLTDSAHFGRKRDDLRNVDFKVRTFNSFWAVAEETANSRFYGGIHTPQDNEVGLAQGKIIAGNVNHLNWRSQNAHAAKGE